MVNSAPWGFHLVLNIAGCKLDKVTDPEYIKEFSKALVKKIDMIAYGEPQVVHFCDHIADKAGYTLIQLIETSNIMAHFIDNSGDCYMDVFSCKEFNIEDVINIVTDWFKPERMNYTFFDRDVKHPKINYLEGDVVNCFAVP